jgi:hypothetical protein
MEDLAYAGAGRLDDFLVGVDEGHAQAPRQPTADACLAGPHEAHENDRFVRVGKPAGHRPPGSRIRRLRR